MSKNKIDRDRITSAQYKTRSTEDFKSTTFPPFAGFVLGCTAKPRHAIRPSLSRYFPSISPLLIICSRPWLPALPEASFVQYVFGPRIGLSRVHDDIFLRLHRRNQVDQLHPLQKMPDHGYANSMIVYLDFFASSRHHY